MGTRPRTSHVTLYSTEHSYLSRLAYLLGTLYPARTPYLTGSLILWDPPISFHGCPYSSRPHLFPKTIIPKIHHTRRHYSEGPQIFVGTPYFMAPPYFGGLSILWDPSIPRDPLSSRDNNIFIYNYTSISRDSCYPARPIFLRTPPTLRDPTYLWLLNATKGSYCPVRECFLRACRNYFISTICKFINIFNGFLNATIRMRSTN